MGWDAIAYHKYYTADEKDLVNKGKLCPNLSCHSENIKEVGGGADGHHLFYCYDCRECGAGWEATG